MGFSVSGWGLLLLPFLAIFYVLYRAFLGPLSDIPGPFLAKFTRLWEVRTIHKGKFDQENILLHRQYGPLVRIGPNKISVDDPSAIRTIYGHGSKFTKSAFYNTFAPPDRVTMFTTPNIEQHAAMRKGVASLYSMTALLSYEPFVNNCISVLVQRFTQFAENGTVIDLGQWTQFYAFDVIGEITFGNTFGYLAAGYDQWGVIECLHELTDIAAVMGPISEVAVGIARFMGFIGAKVPIQKLMDYTANEIKKRKSERLKTDRNDFLSKMLSAEAEGKLPTPDPYDTCASNVVAGSDTTGISLAAILYYISTNPNVLQELREEIDNTSNGRTKTDPSISYQQAQDMPYLQAVIKEGLRMHGSVGLPMPRFVPKGGATICGRFFKEGTEVGVNPWVCHYNREIFGPDAEKFRPERWLDKENAVVFERNLLSFNIGARTCIGKNISLLEITKVVPEIVRRFDLKPTTTTGLNTKNRWLVFPNLKVRIIPRP